MTGLLKALRLLYIAWAVFVPLILSFFYFETGGANVIFGGSVLYGIVLLVYLYLVIKPEEQTIWARLLFWIPLLFSAIAAIAVQWTTGELSARWILAHSAPLLVVTSVICILGVFVLVLMNLETVDLAQLGIFFLIVGPFFFFWGLWTRWMGIETWRLWNELEIGSSIMKPGKAFFAECCGIFLFLVPAFVSAYKKGEL